MEDFVPDNMHTAMMSFIRDITDNTREGLLSLGFILALFFASNGMMALLQGFDKKYEKSVFHSRNILSQRVVALQLVILLGSTLIASVSLIIGGNYLIDLLAKRIDAYYITKLGLFFFRWMAILFLFYVSIAILYRFGPAMKKKFGYITPGATLATLLCLLSSWVFSVYVNSFGTYNELYGSIGVLIVFMIWLKINAFILLVGFELNAAIVVNRDIKEDLPDNELE